MLLRRSVIAFALMVLGCYACSSHGQEPIPAGFPVQLSEPNEHPSGVRLDARYSPQPLWAQRVAEDQRERRAIDRMRPYHPLRPNAASTSAWTYAPYGRPLFIYHPGFYSAGFIYVR